MRFSIRELLALGFVVALVMLAYRTYEDANREKLRLTQLQTEIKSLEARLRIDHAALHDAILRTEEEFESVHRAGRRAVEYFPSLREKYSEMEQRGSDVLSMRRIPSLRDDTNPVPVVYRMLVPKDRPVWLKFGVHMVNQTSSSNRDPDEESDLLTESPFTATGPVEFRLPIGDQTLKIATNPVREGKLSVVIKLNDKVVFQTDYVSAYISHAGGASTAPMEQLNYQGNRPLPWLATVEMVIEKDANGIRPQMTHGCSLWLSDHSSGFATFAGQ